MNNKLLKYGDLVRYKADVRGHNMVPEFVYMVVNGENKYDGIVNITNDRGICTTVPSIILELIEVEKFPYKLVKTDNFVSLVNENDENDIKFKLSLNDYYTKDMDELIKTIYRGYVNGFNYDTLHKLNAHIPLEEDDDDDDDCY